jgi:hypothetical protein
MAQAPDTVQITVDLFDPQDHDDVADVGLVWEVAINGQGYMLAEDPEDGIEYDRGTMPLDPARLATSDTPFAEAIERYSFAASPDWSKGAGQEFLHREESTSAAYWESEGVNPFDKSKLTLLNGTVQDGDAATSYATPRLIVVGNNLYMQTGDAELKYTANWTTWSAVSSIADGTGAVTIEDLTSDGYYWYAATGRSIIRGTTASPAADWCTDDATDVQFAADRIIAAVKTGSSSTGNQLTTYAVTAGPVTEEYTNGVLTLDEEHSIVLGGATGGNYYFGTYAGDVGKIYAWPLGLRDDGLGSGGLTYETPVVAWELPAGLIPKAVHVAGGSVWVHAYQPSGPSAGEGRIYRAVPSGGTALAPFFVTSVGSVTVAGGAFAEVDEHVLFAWPSMGTDSGVGAVNLETGGYTKWLEGGDTGAVQSIVAWDGVAVFSIGASGPWMDSGVVLTSGMVESSIADGASHLDKVWDTISVVCTPLATGESIDIEYSTDLGSSYTSAGSMDTPGATTKSFVVSKKSPTMRLRATLNAASTTSPEMTLSVSMYHPLGLADQVLLLPVNCSDHVSDLRGHACSSNGDGNGARRARFLETLSQTRVKVQDIDWHLTGKTYVYEVEQVRPVKVRWVYDQNLPGARLSQVAMLQLRRVGTS